MKLRIKGNAIRLRLTQTDVTNLAEIGMIEERLMFSKEMSLSYRLVAKDDILKPAATYTANCITVFIPKDFTSQWPANNIVGTSALQQTSDGTELSILIEKDFKCLDDTTEDQSDNFANPKLMNQ